MVSREAIRSVYDGTLFERLASIKEGKMDMTMEEEQGERRGKRMGEHEQGQEGQMQMGKGQKEE
jgi:hypothetical protein